MKKEIMIGGINYTLKRTEDKNGTVLLISVRDVIDMVKELRYKTENVNECIENSDWKTAIKLTSDFLANLIEENDMTIPRQINVDFDTVNIENGFSYEDSLNINSNKTSIVITINRSNWLSNFIKDFIKDYNKLV